MNNIEFGSVKVELSDPITLGPDDYFRERGLLKNEVRNASITSAQEIKLFKLKKEDLLELMSEHTHLFEELSAPVKHGQDKLNSCKPPNYIP